MDIMHIRIAVFFLIMAAFPFEINAASFDCAKARSRAEILICSDPELSSMDDDLAKIYSKAKSLAPSPADFKSQGEREWKKRETTCFDKQCLLAWYSQRRDQLMSIINDQALKPQPSALVSPQNPSPPTPQQTTPVEEKAAPSPSRNPKIYQVQVRGYYGCIDKEKFKKLRDRVIRGDESVFLQEITASVKNGECVMLNKGEQILLEEGTDSSTVIRIKKEGAPNSYWTTPLIIRP